MIKKILVTSVGGAAGNGVVKCIKLEEPSAQIIGTDCDKYMIKTSKADQNFIVPHATRHMDEYCLKLKELTELYGIGMIYPQSDKEIYTNALFREQKKLPSRLYSLPSFKTILLCRNKLSLYQKLEGQPFIPRFQPVSLHTKKKDFSLKFPVWPRATIGAGGFLGTKCDNWATLKAWVKFWGIREPDVSFVASEYLGGRNFGWLSLWNEGKLVVSTTRLRLGWVHNRIGTTGVQQTFHSEDINRICKTTVKLIDSEYSGLMSIDLKEDSDGRIYVTETNVGRISTTCYFQAFAIHILAGGYGAASRQSDAWNANLQAVIDDEIKYRANFPYLLVKQHFKESLPNLPEFDVLPEGITHIRGMDTSPKIFVGD